MDTLTILKKAWKEKHFKHLLYCLENCQSIFEDSFHYKGIEQGVVLVDDHRYSKDDIVGILHDYYVDSKHGYETSFGDAVYLFFTDLVEDDVDILSQVEEEDIA